MKVFLRFAWLSLILPVAVCSLSFSKPQDQVAPGEQSHGLTLLLERDPGPQNYESLPKFRVELRNAGPDDLVLNLGIILANGKKQYPQAISLMVTDSQGKSREMSLIGPPGVAGRVDPFIVPLPAGGGFSLPVNLNNYWSAASQEFEYKFKGPYSIEARYTRRAVSRAENMDAALMPYWLGTVTSNELHFEVAGQARGDLSGPLGPDRN